MWLIDVLRCELGAGHVGGEASAATAESDAVHLAVTLFHQQIFCGNLYNLITFVGEWIYINY